MKGDTVDEADETFTVNLSAPLSFGLAAGAESYPQYAAIDTGSKTTTITDDDTTIRINDSTVQEGDSGNSAMPFIVTLDNPSTLTTTVHVQTQVGSGTATAGTDYIYLSTDLTFTPGQVAKTVNVFVKGDHTVEPNENFSVKLSAATNANIGDGTGNGVIVNDD